MSHPAPPPREAKASQWRLRLKHTPTWFVVFGVFALTGLFQFAAVDWSRPLSIYDEVPHVDYTLRLADGAITTWDDLYSQRTLGLASCLEERSPNPQCVVERERDPRERWPNGHSYEAQQAPAGYLPFVATELLIVDDATDHYSQIRQLRLANVGIWLMLSGLWTALILQVTNRKLPAVAASVVVAMNPLLFDRFTYVTNDSLAIAVAVAVAAWLLYFLGETRRQPIWTWIVPALLGGTLLGLVKPTAMIVLVPIALAVVVGRISGRCPGPSPRWWVGLATLAAAGVTSAQTYRSYVDSRSQLDFETVIGSVLPRAPLDLASASLLRIVDISELVVGTGARTTVTPFEWGVLFPSVWVVILALGGAAAFLVSLALRNDAFPRQPNLDTRIWSYAVLASFVAMLIAHPALHYLEDGFVVPFTAGRFLAPLVPLAGLSLLAAFGRFRTWAWLTVILGLLIAAFGSAPINAYEENLEFLTW